MQGNDTPERRRAPRRPPVQRVCEGCSAPFMARRAEVDQGRARFCSRDCWKTDATGDLAERLRANTKIDTNLTCWLWTGTPGTHGYGRMSVGNVPLLTHQVAWMVASGESSPPQGVIGHTCDLKLCVRNDEPGTYTVDGIAYQRYGHLFLTTQLGNVRDMIQKGRDFHESPKGEASSVAKLTALDVRAIRQRYAAGGISTFALSQEYGVGKSQIKRIVRRESWAHVD